jgi:ABC-type bacteriocin/lantibiotic exporter with double-glycine peptidase domain
LRDTIRKYGALLEAAARRQFYALCALAVGAALLETLAVASIMPFLAALASPEIAGDDPRVAKLYALLGAQSQAQYLAYIGGLVLVILVLANALSAATTWLMLRFAHRQGHALSVRLLGSYLAKPYEFYLDRHVAELQKNVFGEVYRVTSGVLIPAVQIVAKLCVVVFVSVLLVIINPLMALVIAAALGGAYALLYRIARGALHGAGRVSVEAGTLRARHALESLSGAKEIKLLGREAEFLERFREPSLRWADAQTRSQALAQLPRHAVETIAFSLILLLAIYLLSTERGMAELLPLLGVYAFAGYRLIPALQLVFAGFAAMRNSGAALDAVLQDLLPAPGVPASNAAAEGRLAVRQAIELSGVRYRYPGAGSWALEPVTLRIPKNSSVALVGATGCGKTTVVDLLMGLLQPAEGFLRVDGMAIDERNVRAWQRSVGHVPQQIFLCDDTIARNIALGLPPAQVDMARVERAARLARLHDFVLSDLPRGYDTLVGDRGIRLSGGQRQRIGIARALYHDPEVLVFDEATSALDNATENALLESLQGLTGRKTLITVAHRMTTVRHCDRIYVMEKGRIVESGTYAELAARADRFRALNAQGG